MANVKVYVDAGHGGSDAGATGHGIKEKDVTLKIAKKVQEYLGRFKGVSVKMSRTDDSFPSLTDRTNEANSWGADLFLSVHINSAGGVGFESFRYTTLGSSTKTAKIQEEIHNAVLNNNGLKDRGMKQENLHVLRESSMDAILTENGFIDTESESNKMKDSSWISAVAHGHVDGIVNHYGLEKKSSNGGSSSTVGSSESGSEGKLKITSESGSVYVMDEPDKNSSNNLGTASGTLPLNGSIRGKNSDSGYWEVQFEGKLGYVSGNLGEQA